MVDLFPELANNPQNFDPKLVSLVDEMQEKCASEGLSFTECFNYRLKLNKIGYTFDFGLDAEPHSLKKKK